MPFLVPVDTGVPLAAPTFWIVAHRRALGRQPSTLYNELRSLMWLYLWAAARGVDIQQRLREGAFFALTEIIDIVNFCGRFTADALQEIDERSSKLSRLARRRKDSGRSVQSAEQRNRLAAISSFIEFTSADFLSVLAPWPQRWDHYNAVRTQCLDRLRGYTGGLAKPRRDDLGLPEGLEAAALKRLREVIEPDHPDNPFQPEVRFRNYFIIRLLLELGLRRGELLGVKLSDCNLGSTGSLTVHRRPDDPDDPRRDKPSAKTAARVLALNGRMTELAHEWVVHYRAKIPGARRHLFLVVNSRTGGPMSKSNLNKIFEALRHRVPGLPAELSPHILRHSWNDAFSETMDRKGIPGAQEVKWRARLMGWRSEFTARNYLRRTVRRRSNEVLKEMQDGLNIAPLEGVS
ncbi:tyrosine-type recombinase/integrase [Mesorhizobium sp. KR1-2]|uniref:tyrosine-type recombinase/integrase n=1 Tax=Mesorhizobium sp. KR1-2 TaxID=3156609 RepID=UPI0032B629A3